jgi:hypothetical protein
VAVVVVVLDIAVGFAIGFGKNGDLRVAVFVERGQ